MAGIIFTSPNSGKRIDQAITRRLNTSLGFRFYADSSTTPSIASIHPTGVITLSNLYVLGKYNLSVWVNGILRSNVGPSDTLNDYTELNNRQIRLSQPIRDVLAANELTSNIEIRWDRHWPGVRDANLSNLSNMTVNIEDGLLNADSPSAANPFATVTSAALTGEVRWVAYSGAAPTGWLVCDGSTVSQATYPNLYALLGTTWGPDGGGLFTLPDLQGRSPLGSGAGAGLTARSVGDSGGEEDHQLSVAEMPSHAHTGESGVQNGSLNFTGLNVPYFTHGTTGLAGGDVPHNTMHPYAVLQPIIKT